MDKVQKFNRALFSKLSGFEKCKHSVENVFRSELRQAVEAWEFQKTPPLARLREEAKFWCNTWETSEDNAGDREVLEAFEDLLDVQDWTTAWTLLNQISLRFEGVYPLPPQVDARSIFWSDQHE
jgi:hypothetical protein